MTRGIVENIKQQSSDIVPSFLSKRVDEHFQTASPADLKRERNEATSKPTLNFASPDYLGLTQHPTIVDASIRALMDGDNSDSSELQLKFEDRFAEFLNAEALAFFQSAWSPNANLLHCVSDKDVPIYKDSLANLSIREAIESANGQSYTYSRESTESLENQLKLHGAGIIIIDAVSSIDGSIAPIADIAALAEKYNCLFIVDESHSLGIYDSGRGLVSSLHLGCAVHFITADLTKTLCAQAGLIIGSRRNIEYIRFQAKELRFGQKISAQDIAKFSATLNIIQKDEWRRVKLGSNANYLRTRLYRCGLNVRMKKSHIVNLYSNNIEDIEALYHHLENENVATEFRSSPVAPNGYALIRFIVNAKHNKQQIDDLIRVIEKHV